MINNQVIEFSTFSRDFRGAPDGWCSLERVNFLVGENSSGKSSYIQLIELVDNPSFAVLSKVLGEHEGINTAFDAISRKSNATSVTVGHCYHYKSVKRNKKKDNRSDQEQPTLEARAFAGKLVTLKESENNLRIYAITQIFGKRIAGFRRRGNSLYFKIATIDVDTSLESVQQALEHLHFEQRGYRAVKQFSFGEDADFASWMQALSHAMTEAVPGDSDEERPSAGISTSPLRTFQYGPMRRKPHRLHFGGKSDHSPTGDHIPYIIRDMWGDASEKREGVLKFGRDSGLFDDISVATISTKIKDKPFAIQVKKNERYYYADELGYGVGQILPIVADIHFSNASVGYLIQQPELHLHPRAQAAFGEFLFNAARAGHFLVVETHSDYILDRFRLCQRREKSELRAQILFFETERTSDANTVHPIPIVKGQVIGAPEQYREFFISERLEQFDLL